MKKFIVPFICLFITCFSSVSYSQTEADHEALRELLTKSSSALNENNFEAIRPYLDEKFTIITIDNSKFTSLDDFKAYWDKMFKGEHAKLKSISIKAVADDKTYFPSTDVGVVDGTADQTFTFSDGDVRTIQTRWTAVVHKENNQWKLMKIHFSGNILDNPVLDAAKKQLFLFAGIGAIAGLLLGFILMKLKCRSKTA
ncbi:nuclear transport factor 2 family protein [Candidatus Berkiella aquae]|uniref:Nuclear transport factor 2 family protein n=1 Tax=Candidatus Berkiella aquae TaxID=295108 RepID=A0A0Q9Z0J2_9GAMM|nr:nuclear transport factor 2 family protein [Candidatus Berkiella aquae]MCS5710324.1 nuclear transport factor 2 family protein [Candidatus Berkiella aquae]